MQILDSYYKQPSLASAYENNHRESDFILNDAVQNDRATSLALYFYLQNQQHQKLYHSTSATTKEKRKQK